MTNVTVVGCGDHGTKVLLPALHAAGARIVGLHDVNTDRAAAAAERWGTPRLLDSIDEAIDVADAVKLEQLASRTMFEQTRTLALQFARTPAAAAP